MILSKISTTSHISHAAGESHAAGGRPIQSHPAAAQPFEQPLASGIPPCHCLDPTSYYHDTIIMHHALSGKAGKAGAAGTDHFMSWYHSATRCALMLSSAS